MANIFQAIYDFFASIVELIVSTFSTIFHTLKAAAEGILNLLFSFVKLFEDVFKGAIDVVGGVGKFIVGVFDHFDIPDLYTKANKSHQETLSSLESSESAPTPSFAIRLSRGSPLRSAIRN